MKEYKISPDDYPADKYTGLNHDISDYYSMLERYKSGEVSKIMLHSELQYLFFSIKHRVVEHNLTEDEARGLKDYFGGLYDELD